MTLFHTICSSVQPTSAAPFAGLQCLQSGVTIRWRHKKVIHASVMQWLHKKKSQVQLIENQQSFQLSTPIFGQIVGRAISPFPS
jgi:hypothetical protein